ncbi:MAG: hypothetical protein IJ419_12835 [Agathobacter sp.]|nr:hypothetical protein [Agathobacter sp.]
MSKKEAEERLQEELVDRIRALEENSNEIKRMSGRDYMIVGVIIAVCLFFVVVGAFI